MSNSGSVRNYRDSGYQQYPQQQRGENYNNQSTRRANNFGGGRGRRGAGGNSYRGGTQSDAGTGGKCQSLLMFFLIELVFAIQMKPASVVTLHHQMLVRLENIVTGRHRSRVNNNKRLATVLTV